MMEWALRAEAAECEVERMHDVFRAFSTDDAALLDLFADELDREELDRGGTDHRMQDILRAIAAQSRASWAR